jgi:excisionase family DNA binding protein
VQEAKGERIRAFSTGRAARFCYVTPETILNWIRAGLLKAQRTAGGQYRIRIEDLRAFMVERGMETDQLDASQGLRSHCWEARIQEVGQPRVPLPEPCRDCLVRRSGTLNCWELAGLLPLTGRRAMRCAECEYYRTYCSAPPDGARERSESRKEGTPTSRGDA